MKSYIYQAISLEMEKDRDIIEFLVELKERRLASAYVKQAIREKMNDGKEDGATTQGN